MEGDTVPASPLVSVVLPTHNRAKTLRRAVGSVLGQSFDDFELIIVDDASDDGTQEVVAGIQDKRIRYVRHAQRRGAGAARNTGIAVARGEYIAFQDSDDEWVRTKLEEQLAVIGSEPETGAVFSPYIRISPEKREQVPGTVTAGMYGNILPRVLAGPFIGAPTLLVRRSALKRSGVFDEELRALEDWELTIRLAKHYRFACVERPLLHSWVTAGSVSGDEEAMLQAMRRIVALHEDAYRLHPDAEARVWTFIGNRRCLAGRMAEGRMYFRRAIKRDARNASAWCGLLLACGGEHLYRLVVRAKRRVAPDVI